MGFLADEDTMQALALVLTVTIYSLCALSLIDLYVGECEVLACLAQELKVERQP